MFVCECMCTCVGVGVWVCVGGGGGGGVQNSMMPNFFNFIGRGYIVSGANTSLFSHTITCHSM